MVDEINDIVLDMLEGDCKIYTSIDEPDESNPEVGFKISKRCNNARLFLEKLLLRGVIFCVTRQFLSRNSAVGMLSMFSARYAAFNVLVWRVMNGLSNGIYEEVYSVEASEDDYDFDDSMDDYIDEEECRKLLGQ
ncbi:hypothetical protein Ddc_15042 [Ditylenchus destructor]|nr:hypothetical protein Ddc_15042 [Ditylenchus destructor]